jgi:glutathione S-transferase
MVLYTCGQKKRGGSVPGPLAFLAHPCGRAAKALDDNGHEYELKTVGGYRGAFWTWPNRGRDRAEVERLSGQRQVPILVLDDGDVISGSGSIVGWAEEHPAASQAATGS